MRARAIWLVPFSGPGEPRQLTVEGGSEPGEETETTLVLVQNWRAKVERAFAEVTAR